MYSGSCGRVTDDGQTLCNFVNKFQADGHYTGVEIAMQDNDIEAFRKLRAQFFQSLLDNFEQRFPLADLLQEAAGPCLNPKRWPR